jgi:hypothetical protein
MDGIGSSDPLIPTGKLLLKVIWADLGVKLCRKAPKVDIWIARCFAIYRKVVSLDAKVIKGSPEYITFMLNVLMFNPVRNADN